MASHPIKREPQDFGQFHSSMETEQPPAYDQHSRQQSPKSRFLQEDRKQNVDNDILNSTFSFPFSMEVKPVEEYLMGSPSFSSEPSRPPPARQLSPQVFSPLPSRVEQNPEDPIRVVGERSTTNHVANLYEYIQRHAPRHNVLGYDFQEPNQQQFSVVLRLNGLQPIEPTWDRKADNEEVSPRLFPSKKAAKEEVSRIALDALKGLPPPGPDHIVLGPGKSKGESPLGELNKYCSQNGLPRPHIIDTSNSKPPFLFGCEITININGEHKFGDPSPVHQNKKTAQNAAAKDALAWIQLANPQIVKTKGKSGKSSRILTPGTLVEIDATGKSIGEVAAEACVLLGFKAPQRRLDPVEGMLGMYNVYVTLEHNDHISHIGPIKNIFGKKHAGEEAMKVTLHTIQTLARVRFGVTLNVIGEKNFTLFE